MRNAEASVLVVGGSLVGLSAAVFLAARGVRTVLVEKHAGSSLHPRALGFTTRTMELYRAVGLGPSIPQIPPGFGRPRRVTVDSLAGNWATEEVAWTPPAAKSDAGGGTDREYSVCSGAALAQDRLEPILRARALELGADIRQSTALIAFKQDAGSVQAMLRSGDGEHMLSADYMIGADGASSHIRQSLGIGRAGNGHLQTIRSVLFRAPLDQYLESGFSQFQIEQPDLTGMLTTYRDGRWLLMFMDDQERDEATLNATVIRAIGRSDLPVQIITTGRWELSAIIADRFSSGRVFLAGDAAHTLPPSRGGYGANTGIEDVHNLAWKLAAVLSGQSSPALLDTYGAERRPIAWLRHAQIFTRPDYARFATDADREVPVIDDDAMELGQLYRSAAVIGAGEDLPSALRPDQWAGQPGTRAPHVWVLRDGAKVSTLDLLQRDWVLITQDSRWLETAQRAAATLPIKLESVVLAEQAIQQAFGIGPEGASLVRPDGYVAWRSVDLPANPIAALTGALQQVALM
jgi:putative polyketide hydroxylase